MRIEAPTWVDIDRPTYHSISLSLATVSGAELLGANPTMTVRALGSEPALLLQLEHLMASTRFTGDWTARLWAVSPVPRFGAGGTFIVGWREVDDDRPLEAQIHAWTQHVGRAIDAIHVTWMCLHVPTVDCLVDLRSPDAPPSTFLTRTAIRIDRRVLSIHTYRKGCAPPVRAAYDSETHTLYCLS